MTEEDLNRLEALAKSATPGKWSHEPTSFNRMDRILYASRSGSMHGLNMMTLSDGDWNHVNNVEYIASAYPELILSLIRLARKGLVADRLSAVAHEANEVALKQHLPHLSSLPKPGGE